LWLVALRFVGADKLEIHTPIIWEWGGGCCGCTSV
jgi:hypothetical protein